MNKTIADLTKNYTKEYIKDLGFLAGLINKELKRLGINTIQSQVSNATTNQTAGINFTNTTGAKNTTVITD